MDGIATLYLFVLAGVAGYALIARVPSVLHLPLLSGANFVHGVVLCGAMLALARADDDLERVIGFVAVALAAANVVGGYLVTDRLLSLFDRRAARRGGEDGAELAANASSGEVSSGKGPSGKSGARGEERGP